jgi:DNA-binding CsgD family transcriptional regulator
MWSDIRLIHLSVSSDATQEMTEANVRSRRVPFSVRTAAKAVLDARGEPRSLSRIFEHSPVPMVMVDGRRRYVEANRSARLWFRLSLDELRTFAIGELTPAPRTGVMEQSWARLLEVGSVTGRYPVDGSDGSRLDVVYHGIAHVLPGLHLIAFAPQDELDTIENGRPYGSASLTPREIEVLALAAEGKTVPELAQELVLSPATVKTHFSNIYEKLEVGTRAAAVATAMRLGMID